MTIGTVVKCQYGTIDRDYTYGIFIVLYHEANDITVVHDKNVIGLKLTSNGRGLHYDVPILQKYNNFLKRDSYVMCSKPHVLDVTRCETLGVVNVVDLFKIYNMYLRFQKELQEQLTGQIINEMKGGMV